MNITERLIGRSEPYLYERDTDPDHLQRLDQRLRHAVFMWTKETFTMRRDPREVLRAGFEEGRESKTTHVIEGLEFLSQMDLADRASNGLRLAMLTDNRDPSVPSEFGNFIMKAYNNPELSDHNHEHNRRTERWLEAMFLNIGKLRHSDSVVDWLDSAFLYAYFHDIDQLSSLQRNLDFRASGVPRKELSVKKGHALAASVMLLALHSRYAGERLVRKRDAWEKCAGAAYMIMKHDEPEFLMDMLSAKEKAYQDIMPVKATSDRPGSVRQELMTGPELVDKYESNSIDMATISPSQILELLRYCKSETGGYIDNDSVYGLHPEFEREYGRELQDLADNHQPLFRQISANSKESLRRTAEVSVRADLLEMVAPPVEGIFRLLSTQYSQNRPFFRHPSETIPLYDAINRQRKNAGLEDLVPGSIELTVEEIFRGRGNLLPAVDCDMRRMLWNFAHIEPISTGSEIGNSQFITKVNRDNAIMGTLVFRDIGSKIMRGDLSDIDKVYASRINEVAQKSLGTAGIKGFAGFSVRIQGWMYGDFASRVNLTLINQGYPAIASRFAVKVGQLVRESEFLKSNLINKPDGDGSGFPKQYSEAEIRTFREICDAVLERLFNIYSVPVRDRKRYRIRASQGKFPPTTPYKRYDSLADPGHIRTLVRPLATYTAESDEING